jgi:hypothetical protein
VRGVMVDDVSLTKARLVPHFMVLPQPEALAVNGLATHNKIRHHGHYTNPQQLDLEGLRPPCCASTSPPSDKAPQPPLCSLKTSQTLSYLVSVVK